MEALKSAVFAARAADIRDAASRVIRHLVGDSQAVAAGAGTTELPIVIMILRLRIRSV